MDLDKAPDLAPRHVPGLESAARSGPSDRTQRAVLSLRGPHDLVAAVPVLLGFHPEESVVVVGLRDDRIVVTARLDLAEPARSPGGQGADPAPGDPNGKVECSGVVRGLISAQADSCIVVVYGGAACLPAAVHALTADLRDVLAVRDLLHVVGDRFRSLWCDDPACCPPEGRPVDLSSARITAEAVVAGLVVARDRRDVVADLHLAEGEAFAEAQRSTERVLQALGPVMTRVADESVPDSGIALLSRLLDTRRAEPGVTLDLDDLTLLALLLDHGSVRDCAYRRMHEPWLPTQVRLWAEVVQRVEPPLAAVPAALLALAQWCAGGGALATDALRLAERLDPAHPTVRLAADLIHQAVPPQQVVAVFTEAAERDGAAASAPRRA